MMGESSATATMATQTEASFPLPRLHLNGTGQEMLVSGYAKARRATQAAETALAEIEFNARDYYVISDTAYSEARAKRTEMFAKLHEVQAYLHAHLEELC
jgi:hypothetical protein